MISKSLVPVQETTLDVKKQIDREEKIRQIRSSSKSKNTKASFVKWWREDTGVYTRWCAENNYQAFPCSVDQLEYFLMDLLESEKKISTIEQAKWAIDEMHKMHEIMPPGNTERIRSFLKGIRSSIVNHGSQGQQYAQKAAFTINHIRQIQFKDNLQGVRDKALLLFCFTGGFRRSEIESMQIEHLTFLVDGLQVFLPKSKTNQEGKKLEYVNIPYGSDPSLCAIIYLKKWLDVTQIQSGHLFLAVDQWENLLEPIKGRAIAKVIKKYCTQVGLDPKDFSAHSLRAGCITYLLERGVSIEVVADHARHKKIDTTRLYDRNNTMRKIKGIF